VLVDKTLIAVKKMMSPALVLATVNAPYSEQLDAQGLAYCLQDQTAAKAMPGHMSSFFGEVKPALQIDFALLFNITHAELAAAAKAFAIYTGECYPLAA
jgi:hypothetical protein